MDDTVAVEENQKGLCPLPAHEAIIAPLLTDPHWTVILTPPEADEESGAGAGSTPPQTLRFAQGDNVKAAIPNRPSIP